MLPEEQVRPGTASGENHLPQGMTLLELEIWEGFQTVLATRVKRISMCFIVTYICLSSTLDPLRLATPNAECHFESI